MNIKWLNFLFSYCVCFFLYSAFFPLFIDISPMAVSILQVTSAALVMVLVLLVLDSRAYSYYFVSLVFLFFLIVLYCFTLFNPYAVHRIEKLVVLVVIFVFSALTGIYLTFINGRDGWLKVFAYFSLVLTFMVFIGQYYNGNGYSGGRLGQGAEGNPIWIARISGIFILYFLIGSFYSKISIYNFVLALCALLVLMLTGSRGPLLSIVLALLVVGFIYPGLVMKKIGFTVLLLGMLLLGLQALPETIVSRLLGGGASGRDYLFSLAWGLVDENIWGWGLGGFSEQTQLSSGLSYPHNLFLESLVEMGVIFSIALASFIMFSIVCAISLMRREPRDKTYGVLAGLLFYALINSMFSGDLTSPKDLYLLSFFFVCEYWRRAKGNGGCKRQVSSDLQKT